MSRFNAAAFVAVRGLSFTLRMNLPVPCNKRAGYCGAFLSGSKISMFTKIFAFRIAGRLKLFACGMELCDMVRNSPLVARKDISPWLIIQSSV
jgi:hypothetical protein